MDKVQHRNLRRSASPVCAPSFLDRFPTRSSSKKYKCPTNASLAQRGADLHILVDGQSTLSTVFNDIGCQHIPQLQEPKDPLTFQLREDDYFEPASVSTPAVIPISRWHAGPGLYAFLSGSRVRREGAKLGIAANMEYSSVVRKLSVTAETRRKVAQSNASGKKPTRMPIYQHRLEVSHPSSPPPPPSSSAVSHECQSSPLPSTSTQHLNDVPEEVSPSDSTLPVHGLAVMSSDVGELSSEFPETGECQAVEDDVTYKGDAADLLGNAMECLPAGNKEQVNVVQFMNQHNPPEETVLRSLPHYSPPMRPSRVLRQHDPKTACWDEMASLSPWKFEMSQFPEPPVRAPVQRIELHCLDQGGLYDPPEITKKVSQNRQYLEPRQRNGSLLPEDVADLKRVPLSPGPVPTSVPHRKLVPEPQEPNRRHSSHRSHISLLSRPPSAECPTLYLQKGRLWAPGIPPTSGETSGPVLVQSPTITFSRPTQCLHLS